MVDYCGFHAQAAPERLAARDLTSGQSFTYAELNIYVGHFAAALASRGVCLGERVAMLSRNRIECVALHLACARIGAIYVPLNWRLSPAELAALLDDCRPLLLLGDGSLNSAGMTGVPIQDFTAEALHCSTQHTFDIEPDRPSLILYTSGTSGRPKGALLSERNLERSAINFTLLGSVTAGSRFLCDAPMFHVIGLVANIRPALVCGAAFLISDGFVPARTLKRLGDSELGITHYFCVPQMAAALRQEPEFDPGPLRRLTGLFTGGAPHPAANIRSWLDDGVSIVDGFGMSEMGTVFGMPLDRNQIERHAGSVGRPAPGTRVKLVNTQGSDCAPDEVGELLLKGDNIMQGYWQRHEETVAAFTDDGWFRTGDLARCDADGFYWIVGRRKDMFISGGENVYPAEIEAALADHPSIVECAVVGVSDPRWGEVGHLFAVKRQPTQRGELQTFLESRLARYKIPKYITFVDALPRNATGKVLKRELAGMPTP